MAALSTSAFLSKYATLFADNSTRDISELDVRDFRQDIADSFLNSVDRDVAEAIVLMGSYDASTNLFPDVGAGSAADGSIRAGDIYPIGTGGTLGGNAYVAGDLVLALTNAPGQTTGNWLPLRFSAGGGTQDLDSVLTEGAELTTDDFIIDLGSGRILTIRAGDISLIFNQGDSSIRVQDNRASPESIIDQADYTATYQDNSHVSKRYVVNNFISNAVASANIIVGNVSGVATSVAMSGQATIDNAGAVTLSNAAVIAKVLTGYTAGAGTVAATDTILQAIQKLDGNDALGWKVTGTTTLSGSGGAPTIANGGNNLSFTGAGTHSFSSTSATVAGNFTVTSTYTVPAGAAVSAYGSVFNGTITGKGTANDLLSMVRVSGALNNSTGAAVSHVSLRVDTTHGGSITPAASIGIQVVAGNATSIAEVFRGVNSSGQTTHQLFADGRYVWTTKATGSDFGGSMSTNAANGAGHLLHSFQLSGSGTTSHVGFGSKYTGGATTSATNYTYNSIWDARSLIVNHTGFIGIGFRYAPVVTGTQAGTEILRAFIAESGLSGFQCASNAPTAIVHIGASTTAHSSLRIDSGTAPTSPNDGDLWFDGTDVKMRVGGVTKTFTLV
jgi:hypothetical protein